MTDKLNDAKRKEIFEKIHQSIKKGIEKHGFFIQVVNDNPRFAYTFGLNNRQLADIVCACYTVNDSNGAIFHEVAEILKSGNVSLNTILESPTLLCANTNEPTRYMLRAVEDVGVWRDRALGAFNPRYQNTTDIKLVELVLADEFNHFN